MFNVGGGELIVIMLIALIVLGPKRLPDAARQIGKTMGDLRRLSTSFQNEVRTAIDTADDPDRVGSRREVLRASEPHQPAAGDDPPARRAPLVAAPVSEDPAPAKPAVKRPPRKTTSKAGAKATGAKKKSAAKNGTAVTKSAGSKPAARRTKT